MTWIVAIGIIAGAYIIASLGLFVGLIRLLSRQIHPEEF